MTQNWGERKRKNILIKSSINWQQIIKNLAKQSNSFYELLPQVQQTCRREVKPADKFIDLIDAVKLELDKVNESATDALSQIEKNRPIRAQRLSGNFGYKVFCWVHMWKYCHLHSIGKTIGVPIVKEEISVAHQIPTYKAWKTSVTTLSFSKQIKRYLLSEQYSKVTRIASSL